LQLHGRFLSDTRYIAHLRQLTACTGYSECSIVWKIPCANDPEYHRRFLPRNFLSVMKTSAKDKCSLTRLRIIFHTRNSSTLTRVDLGSNVFRVRAESYWTTTMASKNTKLRAPSG